MAAKLPGTARPVSFADLHRHSGMDLAIIAAQLEGGQMVMFDRRQSPHVSVARAVTASAAIPLVFVPQARGR